MFLGLFTTTWHQQLDKKGQSTLPLLSELMTVAELQAMEETFGVRLSGEQTAQIRTYLDLLSLWDRTVNLTRIQSVADQLRFHFFESFWAADRFLDPNQMIADVGSGAGFPGLAMKLFLPTLRLALIEKSAKKIVFLKEACATLSLPAAFFQGRAEDYPGWDTIGLATLRALTPSAKLVDLLRVHGVKLLWLHGSALGNSMTGWTLVRQHLVPGSASRFASLFRCD